MTGIGSLYQIAGLYVETLGRVFDMQVDQALNYHAPRLPTTPDGTLETEPFCRPKLS